MEFLLAGDFPVWFPRYVYDVVGGVKEVVGKVTHTRKGDNHPLRV
jgi:hypothetical protein